MKTVKLSDFYPYDRDKGGVQELHHKFRYQILSYMGGDTGESNGMAAVSTMRPPASGLGVR